MHTYIYIHAYIHTHIRTYTCMRSCMAEDTGALGTMALSTALFVLLFCVYLYLHTQNIYMLYTPTHIRIHTGMRSCMAEDTGALGAMSALLFALLRLSISTYTEHTYGLHTHTHTYTYRYAQLHGRGHRRSRCHGPLYSALLFALLLSIRHVCMGQRNRAVCIAV